MENRFLSKTRCVTLISHSIPTLTIPQAARGLTQISCQMPGPGKFYVVNARWPGSESLPNSRGPGLKSKNLVLLFIVVHCTFVSSTKGLIAGTQPEGIICIIWPVGLIGITRERRHPTRRHHRQNPDRRHHGITSLYLCGRARKPKHRHPARRHHWQNYFSTCMLFLSGTSS